MTDLVVFAPPATDPSLPAAEGVAKGKIASNANEDDTASRDGAGTPTEPSTPETAAAAAVPGGSDGLGVGRTPTTADADPGGAWLGEDAEPGGDGPKGPPVAAPGLEAERGGAAAAGDAGSCAGLDGPPPEGAEARLGIAGMEKEGSWAGSFDPTNRRHQATGDATSGEKPAGAWWGTRRGKALAVGGAVLVAVIIVVGVAAGASSGQPQSQSSLVAEFRQSLPAHTIASLNDTSSPQYRAYEWVTTSDEFKPPMGAARLFRMTQRFAMATLYYSIRQSSLISSTASECSWQYANCGQSGYNTVDSLFLEKGSGSGGAIPREIELLASLSTLSASRALSSTIPTELGKLTALSQLMLGFNDLTGTIPTELGELTRLYDLSLEYNELRGTIPTELSRLTNLGILDLEENLLTGTFPSAMCDINVIKLPDEVTCTCCV